MSYSENKVELQTIDLIKDILKKGQPINNDTMSSIKDLKIKTYNFGDLIPEAVVITVSEKILPYIKLSYSNIIKALKNLFKNSIILFIQKDEIVPIKRTHLNRKRESMINNLVFPSVVVGRISDVQSEDEIVQEILLDARNPTWNSVELKTIKNIMTKLFQSDFRIKYFALPKTINK